jgi:RNA polymerase sigma-B factor
VTDDEYGDIPARIQELRSIQNGAGSASTDHAVGRLRESIVESCLPLADHIARRFEGRGESPDDLRQVARLGLVEAIDRFDPSCGSNFVAFAVPTIMGEVRKHFRDTGWAVRVPRRIKELYLAVSKATGELAQTVGRAPTAKDIAEYLDVDIEDVEQALLAASGYRASSLETPERDSPDNLPLADSIGEIDFGIEQIDNHETLRPLLEALPERERIVLMLRFFGNQTQSQIAERVGISQMHVSRLLARTLGQLRQHLTD